MVDFEILVQLKDEVLDPEARAIKETLISQGVSGVAAVTIAKRYVITLVDDQPEAAEEKIKKIADKYLANPVSQTYGVTRLGP